MTTAREIYGDEVIDIAESRGWTQEAAHIEALYGPEGPESWDAVTLTHPVNWLTEEEFERLFPIGKELPPYNL